DLLPGVFDLSGVEDVGILASYGVNPEKSFSEHTAALALEARASYRAVDHSLVFAPIGRASYTLDEADPNFSPGGLMLKSPSLLANDVTVIGLEEPQAYVRDYFAGDDTTLKFFLSQTPFAQSRRALIDEQFSGPALDPATWVVNDPSSAGSAIANTLQI